MTETNLIQRRFDTYRQLMPHRIREILLVSSLYDAYILEEDGGLEERLWQQYLERGLSRVPRLRKVEDPESAMEIIRTEPIDLLLIIVHEDGGPAVELGRRSKRLRPDLPVALLATDPISLERLSEPRDSRAIDRIFLWQNDPALLLAIIKVFEDLANVDADTRNGDVRVILLVEDSIAHVSSFLPTIYSAIMERTRQLIDDGLNHLHKQLRMRSRAKILLADSYEEALEIHLKYRKYLLGAITDVRFWKNGKLDESAGFRLLEKLRADRPDLPVCIQSAEPMKNRTLAFRHKAAFIDKNSPRLREDLNRFLREYMGFGEFVFRTPKGVELCRARTPRELLERLKTVPADSILHHARHQDFSHWMMARSELKIAEQFYARNEREFQGAEDIRRFLIRVIRNVLDEKQSDVITAYSPEKNPEELQFMRLGEGSLGGKARGIAFLRFLLARLDIRRSFPDLDIVIPPTLVICSSEFDAFLETGDLAGIAAAGRLNFGELSRRFQETPVRSGLSDALRSYLENVREPLAVRSSSLLEDSQHLPLAGLYDTVMLPNNESDPEARLQSLLRAVKKVWASTFGADPRAYLRQTAYRIEDEKMSVVIQKLGGSRHGEMFYPTVSGVARSRNFYPVSYMKTEDGVAELALGLGKTVVEGGPIVRFCPKYPQLMPQFANVRDWLYHTQKEFYALPCASGGVLSEDNLERRPIALAEEHGVLQNVASVYQADSDLLIDSFFYDGPRILTFAKVLRDPRLKLGELLSVILTNCEAAMRMPVEIEFALDLKENRSAFHPLQLRPMASRQRGERTTIPEELKAEAVCYSHMAHGNGRYADIRDVILVRRETFDKRHTREIAREIGLLNANLVRDARPYLLVGFGRWGSTDPSMGIGVRWSQISGVRVLVEVGLKDFNVDPAQGTHFFQNVTSLNIGCLSVPRGGPAFFRNSAFDRLPAIEQTRHLRHIRLETPLDIRVDGARGEAVISFGRSRLLRT